MTTSPYVLGIDVGTSGIRALLVNQETGDVEGTSTRTYPSCNPFDGWSEQNPDDWWKACCEAIGQIIREASLSQNDIGCVGISGQMHGLVTLDKHDRAIRPAILWNDQRTQSQCDQIHEIVGLDRMVQLTGKPVMTGFTAPKILWIRSHEVDCYRKIQHVLLPKDFLVLRLTGVHSTDPSDASGTSLLDLRSRDWSDEILDALELSRSWLPSVTESQHIVSSITKEAAELTGLKAGIPVVAGAGDQAAGGIACGIHDQTAISINLGTSGVVFAGCETFPEDQDRRVHAYCHGIPDSWHVMGVMLSAGGSLRWYRDTFENGRIFEDIIQNANSIAPGSEGLRFLPYLNGERTPHASPDARGSFTGISSRHHRGHFTRAVLEGILFGLKDNLDLIQPYARHATHVRITGGGAQSRIWREMASDIFNMPVATVNVSEGSAFGAALLAMVGSDSFSDVISAIDAHVRTESVIDPTSKSTEYKELHDNWKRLFGILEPTYLSG